MPHFREGLCRPVAQVLVRSALAPAGLVRNHVPNLADQLPVGLLHASHGVCVLPRRDPLALIELRLEFVELAMRYTDMRDTCDA